VRSRLRNHSSDSRSSVARPGAGLISEFEKASLVAKLAAARKHKRAATGKQRMLKPCVSLDIFLPAEAFGLWNPGAGKERNWQPVSAY
jgi:hypothetical protein